ncbi:hypothetical protein [Flavivirga jejuensis]|uniref:Uncharacterized protein n=1 Tax=Flavivirga jejuensis TaxID=870487 RepID=A0ABT8WQN2_9FLAO|nr:hypothetical protein [Flavivirga jejuensis]MDO5975483.1 hypothetical protein [Flavivirga jejuensis]
MRFLSIGEIISALNRGKGIEQFLGKIKNDNYDTFEWIEINKTKSNFLLSYHLVFDESDEGIESIYSYSYVEPDDIYGKKVFESDNIQDILKFANDNYNADNSKYQNEQYLDELITEL